MNVHLRYLAGRASAGLITRREFVGRAAALGLTAAAANLMLSQRVLADGPKKGGTIRIGVQGGSTTDSLDPALAANQVPLLVGRLSHLRLLHHILQLRLQLGHLVVDLGLALHQPDPLGVARFLLLLSVAKDLFDEYDEVFVCVCVRAYS